MNTRYTFYMALFSLIIFGWAFGIVALVFYVQRSTGAKESRAAASDGQSKFGQILSPTP